MRVLVVEDDSDSAELLCLLIGSHGHDVRAAADADAALAMIRESPPDVAFIDYQLRAEKSGNDLAAEIRSTYGSTIDLIATTGYSDATHRELAMRAGFATVMVKPLRFELVLRRLEQYSRLAT